MLDEDDELKLLVSLFSDRIHVEDFRRRMSALLSLPMVTELMIDVAVEMYGQGRRIKVDSVYGYTHVHARTHMQTNVHV
ncbi:hypothetical protein EON63_15380 [archaeon]|nr:MAG: hypothetical protein EON63_15380 [archaeon]